MFYLLAEQGASGMVQQRARVTPFRFIYTNAVYEYVVYLECYTRLKRLPIIIRSDVLAVVCSLLIPSTGT